MILNPAYLVEFDQGHLVTLPISAYCSNSEVTSCDPRLETMGSLPFLLCLSIAVFVLLDVTCKMPFHAV